MKTLKLSVITLLAMLVAFAVVVPAPAQAATLTNSGDNISGVVGGYSWTLTANFAGSCVQPGDTITLTHSITDAFTPAYSHLDPNPELIMQMEWDRDGTSRETVDSMFIPTPFDAGETNTWVVSTTFPGSWVAPTESYAYLWVEETVSSVVGHLSIPICAGGPPTTTTSTLPLNSTPLALDDMAQIPYETATSINVLANDSDPDGDDFWITDVDAPLHGTTMQNGVNTIEYTPTADFVGQDQFDYTIQDENGASASATVWIDVSPASSTTTTTVPAPTTTTSTTIPVVTTTVPVVTTTTSTTVPVSNQPPVAVDDADQTPKGEPQTVSLLDNDYDPDADPITIVEIGEPSHGTAISNPDGTVTYTPEPEFVGTDSFTYTISDGQAEDSGVFQIEVLSEELTTTTTIPEAIPTGVPTGSGNQTPVWLFGGLGLALLAILSGAALWPARKEQ